MHVLRNELKLAQHDLAVERVERKKLHVRFERLAEKYRKVIGE